MQLQFDADVTVLVYDSAGPISLHYAAGVAEVPDADVAVLDAWAPGSYTAAPAVQTDDSKDN